ncbi:hypothetical protein BOX15_Mlig005290g1 [Macrostomum lignano]|uniref:EF-hand domain-containing protein n=1 Tax=Macrostomum lignano TaxID=282301 RepID=A0A267GZB1_9PLAT|nr:hypothetical protein BOX15_Mlig005290g1 [Macrostomum lignano]
MELRVSSSEFGAESKHELPPIILRRYTPSQDIQPEETAPFGITEFETTAKVSGVNTRNFRTFHVYRDKPPWIERLTETSCPFLKVNSSLDDVIPLKNELDRNPDLIGIPLREVDPHYMGRNTFVTVSDERELYRFTSHRSLGVFSPDSELRQAAISIVTSLHFQAFIVSVIILDFLALVFAYSDDPIIDIGTDLFFAVYCSELIIKIIAYGFMFDEHSFLRSGHSVIEVIVISSNVLPMFIPITSMFRQLRVIRVIRLFRLIGTLQFTRKIMRAVVSSIKDLVPVFGLFMALVGFFSLCSLVFYRRSLLGKCVNINYTAIFDGAGDAASYDSVAAASRVMHNRFLNWTDNTDNWQPGPFGAQRCPVITSSPNWWTSIIDDRQMRKCPEPYRCMQTTTGNPDMGFSNYDTLMLSMLSTFRLLCQDWWDNLFVQLSLVNGGHATTLYFLALIFLGSHYVINLVLSTITLSYQRNERSEDTDEDELARMAVLMHVNRDNYLRRQVEIYNVLLDQQRSGLTEPKFLRELNESPVGRSPLVEAYIDEYIKSYSMQPGPNSQIGRKTNVYLNALNMATSPGKIGARLRGMVVRNGSTDDLPIDRLINFVILMNVVEMLVVTPVNIQSQQIIEGTNKLYTIIFTLEAIIKIRYQRTYYLKNDINRFDLIIVFFCLIEMMLPTSGSRMAMVLRMTRFLRLFKLARVSKELERLLTIMFQSFRSEIPLIVVSFVVILISAGIGMVMFQDVYKKNPQYLRPTQNFADLYNSILLVFRIMCGEWTENLWVCMKIMESAPDKGFCVAYFLTNQIIVSLIIFQLYIGILLSKFSEFRSLSREQQERARAEAEDAGQEKPLKPLLMERIKGFLAKTFGINFGVVRESATMGATDTAFSRFRNALAAIASYSSSWYSRYIIAMTILSSAALILDDYYLKSDPGLQKICQHLEIIFLVVFGTEVIVKTIAYGPRTYCSSPWRIIDAIIVLVSLVDVVINNIYTKEVNLAMLRVIRTLRCLRILRTANVWEGFKLTISALFRSVGRLFFAFLIVIIVWLMFALVSTSLFSNKFYRCVHDGVVLNKTIIPNKAACLKANYSWVNKRINFDTTPHAMLALLEVSVFKGWIDILQDISNSPSAIDDQPEINNNTTLSVLIYILFIIIGSFFMIGMLIGVIVDSFEQERIKVAKIVLTDGQRRLQNTLKQYLMFPLSSAKPVTEGWLSERLHGIINTIYVEVFYLVLILVSTVIMALQYHPGKSRLVQVYLTVFDDIILFCFVLEIIMKILGEGSYYLVPLVSWNLIDFLIVVPSVVAEVCEEAIELQYLRVVRFARVFRMGRLLARSTNIKTVRDILLAMVATLPSMLNMIALLIMAICIFAIVGVNLFNDQEGNIAHPFNELFNFRSFTATWRILFIVSTAAGFNDYLEGTMRFPYPYSVLAVVFWVSYLCVAFFVLTNLIVSAVVSSYNEVFNNEDFKTQLQTAEKFTNLWNDFDQNGTGKMHSKHINELLDLLTEPLRMAQPNSGVISYMEIPLTDDYHVCYGDVITALVKEIMEEMGLLDSETDDINQEIKHTASKPPLNTQVMYKLRMATDVIKTAWRQKKLRQSLAKFSELQD